MSDHREIKIIVEGAAGVGKTTIAQIIQKALNLEWIPCEVTDQEEMMPDQFARTKDRIVVLRERAKAGNFVVTVSVQQSPRPKPRIPHP